jgi:predicted nucleotidyltransferase
LRKLRELSSQNKEPIDLIIKIQTYRLKELLKWREYLNILVEAVKKVFDEKAEVYVFGSAVEDRLTVESDIDVAIVIEKVPEKSAERIKLLNEIWSYMEERGVPWWYPFEIHLVTRRELMMLRGSRFIKIL